MYEILGLKHVFSTFQETVWSHLKWEESRIWIKRHLWIKNDLYRLRTTITKVSEIAAAHDFFSLRRACNTRGFCSSD